MLHLVCTFSIFAQNRLAQFVTHYRNLGIDRFWLTPHVDPKHEDSAAAAEAIKAIGVASHDAQVRPLPLLSYDFDAKIARHHHDQLQRDIPSGDWIVWADIDEMQAYPEPLESLIAQAERNREGAVSGEFVDRIDREGRLTAFDPERPIGEQYPVGCNLSATVMRGFTHKVVLARSSVRVTSGNHEVLESPDAFRFSESLAAVHHFKWDDTVPTRLAQRLEAYRRKGLPCWIESQYFLDYMEAGQRLNLAPLKVFDFETGAQTDGWTFVHQLRKDNAYWRMRRGFTPVEAAG